jgi:hypothetical protein
MREQAAEKGQGLCPWTPLGFETPNPQILQKKDFKGLPLMGSRGKAPCLSSLRNELS